MDRVAGFDSARDILLPLPIMPWFVHGDDNREATTIRFSATVKGFREAVDYTPILSYILGACSSAP